VIKDARQCYDAGARAIHIHARNPLTGLQFSDLSYYQAVTDGIREDLGDVPLIFPTSRKGEVELQIEEEIQRNYSPVNSDEERIACRVRAELLRAISMEACPDRITTFTPPELLIAGNISSNDYAAATSSYSEVTRMAWKDPIVMKAYFRALTDRIRALGLSEELEITTWKAFDVIEGMIEDPTLSFPQTISFVILLGFSAHLPIAKETYNAAIERVQQLAARAGMIAKITVGAAISPPQAYCGPVRESGQSLPPCKHDYREVIEWVADDSRVASFRVGLEDTPELFGQKPSNADLVEHVREVFGGLSVPIELDIIAARRAIGLKDKVLPLGPALRYRP
jgi:uncharacterized protein (DUF849 family)